MTKNCNIQVKLLGAVTLFYVYMLTQFLWTSVTEVYLGFDSRAGQIGHSVAKDSPSLRRFCGAVWPMR